MLKKIFNYMELDWDTNILSEKPNKHICTFV